MEVIEIVSYVLVPLNQFHDSMSHDSDNVEVIAIPNTSRFRLCVQIAGVPQNPAAPGYSGHAPRHTPGRA